MHEELNSYFGAGVKMNGVLKFKGALRFDGIFQGEIRTDDTLIVGNRGKVEAKVFAGTLFNMGEVIGDVKAAEKISIFNESHLTGNIDTPVFQSEEGAVFKGNCQMPDKPPKTMKKVSGNGKKEIEPALLYIENGNRKGEYEETAPWESSGVAYSVKSFKGPLAVLFLIFTLGILGFWFVDYSKKEFRDNFVSRMIYQYSVGDDSEKLLSLAKSWYEAEEYEKAAVLFLRVNDLIGSGFQLKKELAISLDRSGRFNEAVPFYEEYLQKKPDEKEISEKLADFYKSSGNIKGQIKIQKIIVSASPNNKKAAHKLFSLHKENDQLEKALEIYQELVVSDPPKSEDLMIIGQLQRKVGKLREASETFKDLLRIDSDNKDARLALANLYYKFGYEKQAALEFRRLGRLDSKHVEEMNNTGYEHLTEGLTDKAIEFFNLALAQEPDNIRAYHGLATTYSKLGEWSRSIYYCNKILELDPDFTPALNRLAWALAMEMKDLDIAEKRSIDSMKYDSNLPDYIDTLAEIYFRKGEYDKAIENVLRAMKLNPGNAWFLSQLKKFREAKVKNSPAAATPLANTGVAPEAAEPTAPGSAEETL
ncbi:MAG: tetratricopeptide repeat protein [Nitrospinota bacterium]|nr:tetratricopeptide repeat protein [Nitrospinota bacterium]